MIEYARCLIDNPNAIDPQLDFVIGLFALPVVLMHLHAGAGNWMRRLHERLGDCGWAWTEALGYAGMIWLIMVNSGTPGEFIYFQF